MYLFNKRGNKVDLYTLTPNDAELKKYREEELLKAYGSARFYCAVTNGAAIFEEKDVVSTSEINFDIDGQYHLFKEDTDKSVMSKKTIINDFFNGIYNNCRVIKVLDDSGKICGYLLLTQDYYCRYDQGNTVKHIENIILIPKSLYLLQMLMQERFNLLYDENINDILQMFTLSRWPVDRIIYGSSFEPDRITKEELEMYESSKDILKRKRAL